MTSGTDFTQSTTLQVPPELAPVALFSELGGKQSLPQVLDSDPGRASHRHSAARPLSGGLSEPQVPDNLRRHCDRLEAELAHEKKRVESLAQEVERARAVDLEWQRQRVAVEAERVEEREELKRMSEELLREREHCCALQARLDAALQEIDDLRSAVEIHQAAAEQQQQQQQQQDAARMRGPAGEKRAAASETVGFPGMEGGQERVYVKGKETEPQDLRHKSCPCDLVQAEESRDMAELVAQLREKEIVLR
jgi:chromosome segregation ATPase